MRDALDRSGPGRPAELVIAPLDAAAPPTARELP